jgi:hypothetical protein
MTCMGGRAVVFSDGIERFIHVRNERTGRELE